MNVLRMYYFWLLEGGWLYMYGMKEMFSLIKCFV